MKTTRATSEKNPREPRLDCRQPNYSPVALELMEQATGQRWTKLPPTIKPPAAAAVDSE